MSPDDADAAPPPGGCRECGAPIVIYEDVSGGRPVGACDEHRRWRALAVRRGEIVVPVSEYRALVEAARMGVLWYPKERWCDAIGAAERRLGGGE